MSETQKKPIYKKWWLWLIVAVVILVIIGSVFGTTHEHEVIFVPEVAATCTEKGCREYWYCEGCGKYFTDKEAKNTINKADLVLEKVEHNYVKGYCSVCKKEDLDYVASIGDVVVSGSGAFKVVGTYNTKQVGTNVVGSTTQNNYLVVMVVAQNIGNTELKLTSSMFKVTKGSAVYNPSTVGIYLDNGFYVSETLGAGITKQMWFVFETPTAGSDDEYILTIDCGILATPKSISLKNEK